MTENSTKLPAARSLCVVIGALALSACVQSTPKIDVISVNPPLNPVIVAEPSPVKNGKTAGEERFPESAYGVEASPVAARGPQLPRGGGYRKVGTSYMVQGARYYPTENPQKIEYGRASWYGTAFHGRKTANGEIYDMNHLSGAHKTMPLPSYARVTNVKNGHSVIVRINDRGPFSNNRLIDLSKRAAELLDYTLAGTAEVKVEYIGPAPLHGQDDDYLLSSIRNIKQMPKRTAQAHSGNTPATPVAAYVSYRINTAFDMYQTQRTHLLWKRLNAAE